MSNIYDLAKWREGNSERDLTASHWIARLDRRLTDDEIAELLAWSGADSRNERQLLELSRLWDRMDILAKLRDEIPVQKPT